MKNTFNIKTVFTTLAIVLGIATTSAQEVQNYDQGFRLGVGINGGKYHSNLDRNRYSG